MKDSAPSRLVLMKTGNGIIIHMNFLRELCNCRALLETVMKLIPSMALV